MRKTLLAIASCFLFAQTTPQDSLNKMIDQWHQSAAQADEKGYFDVIASEGIYMGTDATERWDKESFRRFAQPHFKKGKAWSFKAIRRATSFSLDRKTAWWDEDLSTPNLGPSRGTGVAILTPSGWKIVFYNLSVPIPNPLMSQVKSQIENHLIGVN